MLLEEFKDLSCTENWKIRTSTFSMVTDLALQGLKILYYLTENRPLNLNLTCSFGCDIYQKEIMAMVICLTCSHCISSLLLERWVRFGNDLVLLDSPGIIPMRISDQSAAIKLAICDDIGERSYDVTDVAAILVQILTRLPAVGMIALFTVQTSCLLETLFFFLKKQKRRRKKARRKRNDGL